MKILEYLDFTGYKPIILYIKGQSPIEINSEKSREKDLLIRSITNEFYPNLIGYKEINGTIVNSNLINKAQKNTAILYEIVYIAKSEGINIKNADELLKYISENKYDLFNVNGKYFSKIYNRLKSVSELGKDVEIKAKNIFIEYSNSKGISIQLEEPTEEEDKKGIDIYFIYNDKKWTIQTKTLSSIKEKNDYYSVYISGYFTKINTNYLILISDDKNYIFNGKNISTITDENGEICYYIPKRNLLYIK